MKHIVIYGNSSMSEVVAEYIELLPGHKVVSFTVEREFIQKKKIDSRRIVPVEELDSIFGKDNIGLLVLTVVGQGSPRVMKKRKMEELKSLGYQLFTFIDPGALVAPSAQIGENCIVSAKAIVEPFSVIEDGVFIRSGAYVSHGSRIGECSYLAPGATVAGKVKVGRYCFLGVNCTIHDRKKIGDYALVGGGAVVTRDVPEYGVVRAAGGTLLEKDSKNFNI